MKLLQCCPLCEKKINVSACSNWVVIQNNALKQTNKMLWDFLSFSERIRTSADIQPADFKSKMKHVSDSMKQKNKYVLKMCFGDKKSGHSSYVTNGCWGRGLRPGWKPTSPRSVGHTSLQHHKNCLASLLVQGHPVERSFTYQLVVAADWPTKLFQLPASVQVWLVSRTFRTRSDQGFRARARTHRHTHTAKRSSI